MSEDLGEDLPVEMNTGDIIVDLKKFAMATLCIENNSKRDAWLNFQGLTIRKKEILPNTAFDPNDLWELVLTPSGVHVLAGDCLEIAFDSSLFVSSTIGQIYSIKATGMIIGKPLDVIEYMENKLYNANLNSTPLAKFPRFRYNCSITDEYLSRPRFIHLIDPNAPSDEFYQNPAISIVA